MCGEGDGAGPPHQEPLHGRRGQAASPRTPRRRRQLLSGASTRLRIAGAASREARAAVGRRGGEAATAARYGADAFPKARPAGRRGPSARAGTCAAISSSASSTSSGTAPRSPECAGGTAVLATANVVAFAADSAACLRSESDLNVLAVLDGSESVWELAVFGGSARRVDR